jgi:hypothetical protein
MARFKHKDVGGTVSGEIDFNPMGGLNAWNAKQDIDPFLELAKEEKQQGFNRKTHYRKFATIPDIVAIEIHTKYGVNIHDPNIKHDTEQLAKFKKIILQDYPHLVVSS